MFLYYLCLAQGDQPNARSYGKPAAANTDGFDCSTTDLIIERCSVINQVWLTHPFRADNLVMGNFVAIGRLSGDQPGLEHRFQ